VPTLGNRRKSINGNDIDLTSFFQHMEIKKNGDFIIYTIDGSTQYEDKGTWEFGHRKETLYLTFDTGGYIKFEVKRLTKKEFWFEYYLTDSEGIKYIVEERHTLRKD